MKHGVSYDFYMIETSVMKELRDLSNSICRVFRRVFPSSLLSGNDLKTLPEYICSNIIAKTNMPVSQSMATKTYFFIK